MRDKKEQKTRRALGLLMAALTMLILLVFLTACSKPEGRKEIAESTGTVIYQNNAFKDDINDIFLVIQDNRLKIVFVSAAGAIYKVNSVPGYKLIKD